MPPVSSFLAFIVSLDVSALYVLSLSCACTVENSSRSPASTGRSRKCLIFCTDMAIL